MDYLDNVIALRNTGHLFSDISGRKYNLQRQIQTANAYIHIVYLIYRYLYYIYILPY